jgi:hypothetical protein
MTEPSTVTHKYKSTQETEARELQVQANLRFIARSCHTHTNTYNTHVIGLGV